MDRRKTGLRALRNLCTFIGAIALFSFFYNFAVDLRHWYVTLVSALVCALLWFGFCIIEVHAGGVAHLSRTLVQAASAQLAALRTKQLPLQFPNGIEPPQDAPAPRQESALTTPAATKDESPRPTLPFLRPPNLHRPT